MDHQLYDDLTPDQVKNKLEKVGPNFEENNFLKPQDANRKRDYVQKVELSDEFLELASKDLEMYR